MEKCLEVTGVIFLKFLISFQSHIHYNIYLQIGKMKIQKRSWTQEEDTALLALIKLIGVGKWQQITQALEIDYEIMGRTGKQCRERWLNHLHPDVNKGPWSQEEETQLFLLRKAFGHKWKQIAENMPGRTDNEVKNHFYKKVRKNLRHYNKTH